MAKGVHFERDPTSFSTSKYCRQSWTQGPLREKNAEDIFENIDSVRLFVSFVCLFVCLFCFVLFFVFFVCLFVCLFVGIP